ncbi:DUF6998 domain-containing protein [Denitratisoma oestradiolicum]|uniref:DUF6998 domain-containing protein n=1 Tax=Denitratisoma oestradiolicum TaxID=311182 RepID=A0A6S6YQY7_9PROT|nr:hypothetical protein [Denitratisoma oestradiolicum]TWO80380.1 hypothetical protein CBW56_09750 [Denitratisoma oestradiolicum]CAB1370182.1 conserved protein of unknown function [Denitratisoma oestradiolicum]
MPTVLSLPQPVIDLWRSQQALAKHYSHTGLKFTLDGRLVGDIAEALALEHFDLSLPAKRTKGVDAMTASGDSVQVKASGLKNAGPAFTPGTGIARYLLFFYFDFPAGLATILYNGLEAPVRAQLLPKEWTGTRVVNLAALRDLAHELGDANALPLKKQTVIP